MQRTHLSNSKAIFLLLAIALIATTFSSAQAQATNDKPVQTPERVGVETADALPLSLNEAIKLALENSNDIRTSRIHVEKAEHSLTARRGAYDPQLFSETYFERSSTPIASFLGWQRQRFARAERLYKQDRHDWPLAKVWWFIHL